MDPNTAKSVADEVCSKLRRKAQRSLKGDKLVMHTAWADLGDVIDEIFRLSPSVGRRVEEIRSTLFVEGRHNVVTLPREN